MCTELLDVVNTEVFKGPGILISEIYSEMHK